jgi:hypothetical protein
MQELSTFEGALCANCQAPLQGEYCHHCGQAVHSVLRPVHGLFEEFFETFLHVDGRILHTIPALYLKPGYLTLEYFSGRRVRYIAPFRLMFVLCLLSFFALHLATDLIGHRIERHYQQTVQLQPGDGFANLQTPAEVAAQLHSKLGALEAARAFGNPAVVAQVDQAEQKLRERANARLAELGAPASAASAADTAPSVDEVGSQEQSTQIHLRWLPAFANERLSAFFEQAGRNWRTMRHGTPAQRQEAQQRFEAGIYAVLPGTMLVLVPAFALLLKLFYLFKRRLYMEHLIVSLHSHAFLFVSLLLIVAVGMLQSWLRPLAAPAGQLAGWVQGLLIVWVPIYLLLMQKRVYRQGWLMTSVKYWFVGWCYFWLLVLFLLVATVLGLAH